MNGLTGKKMQDLFDTLVPPATSTNARYLVEYCCFRFLSRDSSEFHPCLKVQFTPRLLLHQQKDLLYIVYWCLNLWTIDFFIGTCFPEANLHHNARVGESIL